MRPSFVACVFLMYMLLYSPTGQASVIKMLTQELDLDQNAFAEKFDQENTRAGRTRRSIRDFPLCDNNIPACSPMRWVFSCRATITCKLDRLHKHVICPNLTKHIYSYIICCSPRCSK